ncbi:YjfB family protein [Clostridium bowmanii]|uniref:YjfB family protein n=1 Tax=Clostridium bowmanii TaxID=132925 RepID=UPI0028B10F0A|nr:YjfB family protein [Clostridium bowmanii]
MNIGGITMDIGALSIVMSQSRVQESAGIAVMKMAMDTGKETATQMTEIMKNVAVDTNVGQHLDTRA